MNTSVRTVQRQLKKFKDTSSFHNKDKQERPKKVTEVKENHVVAWVEEERCNTASKLSKLVQETFVVDGSDGCSCN